MLSHALTRQVGRADAYALRSQGSTSLPQVALPIEKVDTGGAHPPQPVVKLKVAIP